MTRKIVLAIAVLGLAALAAPAVLADMHDGQWKLNAELRTRDDNMNNYFDFDDDEGDRFDFWPYRIRLGVEGMLAKNVSVRIDIQNFGSWGNQSPPQSGATFGNPVFQGFDGDGLFGGLRGAETSLYQGVIGLKEIGGSIFDLYVGRQELNVATGLIIGNEPFYNGQTFDGVKGVFDFKSWDLTGVFFTTNEGNDPSSLTSAGNPGSEDDRFFGAYGSFQFGDKTKSDFDGYWFHHQNLDMALNTRSDIFGVNWRRMVKTKADAEQFGLDWNVELAIEQGEDEDPTGATSDFDGWAFEGWAGWTFVTGDVLHRVSAGVISLAGDDDLTDSDAHGWSGLFPTVHGRFGNADFFGASFNAFGEAITASRIGYQITGGQDGRHKGYIDFWSFEPTEDSVRVAPGPGGTVDVEDYGTEIDLGYKYMYSENVTVGFGLAQLSPDDGLTGGSGNPDDAVMRYYGTIRLLVP